MLDRGRIVGQGEVFEVLGRTMHGDLGEPLQAESLLPVGVKWPHENGEYVRCFLGSQEITVPFKRLSTGARGFVTVRPEDVVLAVATGAEDFRTESASRDRAADLRIAGSAFDPRPNAWD